MSDMGDDFKAHADHVRRLRAMYGVLCPKCVALLPKASPTILLPFQRCRIHDYRDTRPELTEEQRGAA